MDIPKKLQDEIWDYCRLNNIPNIDEFINKMVGNGFNVEKYGTSPFGYSGVNEPPEPEIIEKEVIKEVEKIVEKRVEVPVEVIKEVEVEKIVEKKIEVPVEKVVVKEVVKEVPVEKIVEKEIVKEVVKEVPIEKIVYKTDDEVVNKLQEQLELEIRTSKAQFKINEELVEEKNSIFEELTETKQTLEDSISSFDEDRKSFGLVMKEREEEYSEELGALRQELDAKVDVVVDEKYKKFWEEEVKSHDETKKRIKELEEIINHLQGKSDDKSDIYGSDNKGWWGGGSNLFGKK